MNQFVERKILVQMKRIFRITALILLTLLLILSAVSCGNTTAASDSGACGSGVTWSYDGDTKTLTISGNGTMTDFEKSTDVPWLAAKASVKSITVSEGVQNIGSFAFYSFTALESVSLPATTLTSVGKSAFSFCTALKALDLPDSITTIGDYAFSGCSALTAAFIPTNVTTLGTGVFSHCYSLTDAASLTVTALPAETFFNCRSLERFLLIEGAQTANEGAFDGCPENMEKNTTASPNAVAKITVKFVYENGETAADDIVKENLAYGDSYSIVSPSVEGYTADKLTVTGNLYGADKTETVKYIANKVEEAPAVTEEPKEEIGASTIAAIVIFAVVLIGIGVGAFLLMRSEKKNAKAGTTVRKNTNDKSKKRK